MNISTYYHLPQGQQALAQEPIYHTLDPGAAGGGGGGSAGLLTADGQQFDTLGRLDVMLPNGQFVPATLVRQKGGAGGVVPLVEMPQQQQPASPYARKQPSPGISSGRRARGDKRHFV